MKNLRPEEENLIKNITNLFRLEKDTKGIKDKILRDIKNLSEEYFKPLILNNFLSNNYIEIRSYLKDINDLKNSESCKIQLTIRINFF